MLYWVCLSILLIRIMWINNKIDIFIIVAYILLMLRYAIFKDKISTIIDFSLHKRAFSSKALFFTIIATMIGGTGFANKINQFYFEGWRYLLVVLGIPLQTILICKFLIPKAEKTLGHVSVSSFMGEYYGDKVRVITAISSSIGVSGFIASQYKIIGVTGNILFPEISNIYFIILATLVVGIYSYYGGVNSVILTDIVQSICFILSFVILMYYLYPTQEKTIETLSNYNADVFYFNTAFKGLSTSELLLLSLSFSYFFIPSFSSTQFQRFAIAKNQKQLNQSWWSASLALLVASILPCIMSYWIFIQNPELKKDKVYEYLLNSLEFPGTKAVLIVGIMAMAMSTADSHLNTATTNLANDTWKRHTLTSLQKLKYAQNYIILLSFVSISLAYFHTDFLKLVLFANSFYMPLITIPLIGAILGYVTTTRCLLFAIIVTFISVLIGHILTGLSLSTLEPIMPCMFLNFVILISYHYIVEKWELLRRFGIRSKLKGK
jgi:Na+/proline symporter